MDNRFENVSCSQCGQDFGPGDHGFSHCRNHWFADWLNKEGCLLDTPTKDQCVDAQQRAFEAALSLSQDVARPTDDELWDQTLHERDEYHEMADKLSVAIAAHFGVDIGEHSNANCPWEEALELIENADSLDVARVAQPIYQVAYSDEDGWCDTHKKIYDDHPDHMRRIVYGAYPPAAAARSMIDGTTAASERYSWAPSGMKHDPKGSWALASATSVSKAVIWQWKDPNGNWIALVDETMYERVKSMGAIVRALAVIESTEKE